SRGGDGESSQTCGHVFPRRMGRGWSSSRGGPRWPCADAHSTPHSCNGNGDFAAWSTARPARWIGTRTSEIPKARLYPGKDGATGGGSPLPVVALAAVLGEKSSTTPPAPERIAGFRLAVGGTF